MRRRGSLVLPRSPLMPLSPLWLNKRQPQLQVTGRFQRRGDGRGRDGGFPGRPHLLLVVRSRDEALDLDLRKRRAALTQSKMGQRVAQPAMRGDFDVVDRQPGAAAGGCEAGRQAGRRARRAGTPPPMGARPSPRTKPAGPRRRHGCARRRCSFGGRWTAPARARRSPPHPACRPPATPLRPCSARRMGSRAAADEVADGAAFPASAAPRYVCPTMRHHGGRSSLTVGSRLRISRIPPSGTLSMCSRISRMRPEPQSRSPPSKTASGVMSPWPDMVNSSRTGIRSPATRPARPHPQASRPRSTGLP